VIGAAAADTDVRLDEDLDMDMYRALVLLHIGFGVVALATFWTAAWLRKGSSLHRRVGTSYLLAMLGVLGTALPMSAVFLWRGQTAIGVFLAYLVVITATACWLARRAVRLKRDRPAYYDARFRAVAWINLVAGVGVFALGIAIGHALLYLFCWVGVAIGVGMLRDLRLTTAPPNWWLREHYGSMLGNGVATHVAFLGIGRHARCDREHRLAVAGAGAVDRAARRRDGGRHLSGPSLRRCTSHGRRLLRSGVRPVAV
jgi:hypothetical protein